MKSLYRLCIDPLKEFEGAWEELESHGVEILYGSEEEGQKELFAHLNSKTEIEGFSWITECSIYELPSIDWEAQWAAHGQSFHDGYVHVDLAALKSDASTIKLQPGPGFGDLSHPTTRLALQLLGTYLKNQSVIDIGCGSGVLSVAAAALGSPSVYGIDIDPEAINHSQTNACLNHLEKGCIFCLPTDFIWQIKEKPVLIIMNMIQSEQQIAWDSLPNLHQQPAHCITSGIRTEDREEYLKLTSGWGWVLEKELEEEEWSAFYFRSIL